MSAATEAYGEVPAGTRRTRNALLAVGGGLGALLAGLLTLAVIGIEAGPIGLAIGLVLALLPAPIYLLLALRIDRYEPEPVGMLAATFVWGATGAVFIAIILNSISEAVVSGSFGPETGALFGANVSAPVVEETAKGLALFVLYRWRPDEFNGLLDGMVYAAMVGLGFATTENILYYARAAVGAGVPLELVFFLRGVLSPFSHPIFTAMTGFGLAAAAGSRQRWIKITAPVLGLLAAMALHALWNGSTSLAGGLGFLLAYPALFVPIFVAMLAAVAAGRRRELRTVRHRLTPLVERGLLPAHEVEVLSSGRLRKQALRSAKRAGRPARRARRALHVSATELAFHHVHVERAAAAGRPYDGSAGARYEERLRSLLGQAPGYDPRLGHAAAGPPSIAAHSEPVPSLTAHPHIPRQTAAPAPPPPATPPGWHPDPWGYARLRWWDGVRWTGHTAV